MALDPLTAKILGKVAVDAITDPKKRKQYLTIILIPIAIVFVYLAFIVYVITSPLSALVNGFSIDEMSHVEDLRDNYGFMQYLSETDEGYTESLGSQYEGVILKSGETEVVYFNQMDSRWSNIMYGTSSTIGQAGCGPTSLAIVVSTLTGTTVDPLTMANWSYQNGYRCEGNGSYHTLIPNGAKYFGLNVEGDINNSPQKIIDALSGGKLIIAIMGKGAFTQNGHFIVLRGITADGKILVADPASYKRSEQEWDLSLVISQVNKSAAAGGGFWVISK